ncbi:MBL fold metallo-hydrolase [Patescibacteria group bacterium]|nr:MBL fold metallo-hydrolase [Patescibacteria group bacterium]MBU1721713.1 MBL fold metallo-hydrolase [Patescibacteria group bacterium]MBU1901868.1 MBL fold metallo-hydrolase [Patescibacteria group bacterium]
MKIHFHGAAHGVTGSCHLIETAHKKILFDCGMFQGSNFNESKNHDDFPFDPASIDVVIVSHAHIDHTGRVPKLVKDGFKGPIYMTKGTCRLAALIWEDAYHIMQYDYEKFNVPLLYSEPDIERTIRYCQGVDYHEYIDLGDGERFVFKDAGHIFGSAFIELEADGKRIGFSGDIGNVNVPILKETDQLGAVDVLLTESTYGDRIHETEKTRKELLLRLIKEGCTRGGAMMMPAFSLERTQEILYVLDELFEEDKTLPDIPVFLDSPLAIKATRVYKQLPEYYDVKATEKYMSGNDFLDFARLRETETVEQSKGINQVPNPKLIIAGAGMMNGGRILHHAKRYLSDPNATLIIVGYQAEGTLGRRLYEGAEQVTIHNDTVKVRCQIKAIGALSAHGDQKKILSWIRNAEQLPKKIYCVHGEPHAATVLAHKIKEDLHVESFVAELDQAVEV